MRYSGRHMYSNPTRTSLYILAPWGRKLDDSSPPKNLPFFFDNFNNSFLLIIKQLKQHVSLSLSLGHSLNHRVCILHRTELWWHEAILNIPRMLFYNILPSILYNISVRYNVCLTEVHCNNLQGTNKCIIFYCLYLVNQMQGKMSLKSSKYISKFCTLSQWFKY